MGNVHSFLDVELCFVLDAFRSLVLLNLAVETHIEVGGIRLVYDKRHHA